MQQRNISPPRSNTGIRNTYLYVRNHKSCDHRSGNPSSLRASGHFSRLVANLEANHCFSFSASAPATAYPDITRGVVCPVACCGAPAVDVSAEVRETSKRRHVHARFRIRSVYPSEGGVGKTSIVHTTTGMCCNPCCFIICTRQ